jgi:hypothetical protein
MCGDWTKYLLKKYKDRLLQRKYLTYFNSRNIDSSHKLALCCQPKRLRNIRKLEVTAQCEQTGPRPGGAKKINV